MPTKCRRPSMLDGSEFGLPDQRSIAKDPKLARCVQLEQAPDQSVVVSLREMHDAGPQARVRLKPFDSCDQLGGQRHWRFEGGHRRTLLRQTLIPKSGNKNPPG